MTAGDLRCTGDPHDARECCYCPRGFMTALPAIFVSRTGEWHNVCPMCIRFHFTGRTMHRVRRMLRVLILGHEPTEQKGLTT